MNKQELEQKIASMEIELAELKNELTQKYNIWQPKEYEEYWTIGTDGEVWLTSNETNTDKKAIKHGNYFKTKEEAEKQAEYNRVINLFRKYVETYSEPLDWKNNQEKCYIRYDYLTCEIVFDFIAHYQDAFQIYASSEQILKDAIVYSAGSEDNFKRIIFGVRN